MANPTLIKSKETTNTLTANAKNLLREVHLSLNKEEKIDDNVQKIKVSELISKMSFYYEKIRNSVDYKEEHLLRKNSIERVLKREIVIQGSIKKAKPEGVAKHLIVELIRAGYLKNNTIPETKIKEITEIIVKFLKMRSYAIEHINPAQFLKKGDVNKANDELRIKQEYSNWILALMASEIEANLGKDKIGETVVTYMYDVLSPIISLPDDTEYSKDLNIQVYISIFRNYLKYDDDMINLILMKYFVAGWEKLSDVELKKIGNSIHEYREAIENQLHHPITRQVNRIVKKYTVFFQILCEVLEDGPEKVYNEIMKDPKAFPRHIKNVCENRYKITKKKLWRAAARSFLYIFLTKSVFAVLLEVPATKFFGEELNMFALGVNVAFPAFLLLVVVAFTKLPKDENTNKITQGIKEIFFDENKRNEPYKLRKPVKRGVAMSVTFGFIYAITFIGTFGFIIRGLVFLGFNFVSIIIFLFFLAFVSFFSIRIKKGTKEYLIVEQKENLFALLMDFFSVPVIVTGKWLSEKFSKINVFVFVLDFIIEAPFKIFVEIAEEWTKYVKERKEEIS